MIAYNWKSIVMIFLFVLISSGLLLLIQFVIAKIKGASKSEALVGAILWIQSIIIYAYLQWHIAIILWFVAGIGLLVVFKMKQKSIEGLESVRFISVVYLFMATLICIVIVPLMIELLNIVDTVRAIEGAGWIYLNNALSISGIIFWLYYIELRPGAPIHYLISPKHKPKDEVEKVREIVNGLIYILIFILIHVVYAIVYFRI